MISVLFDTCIFMYLMQKREPFFDDAHKLFTAVANRQIKGFLTAKSILDIYYLLHRTNHSVEDTKKSLTALFNLFEILDTAAVDCKKAVLSGMPDFEDAVMTETALREGVNCIVTRNLKDFRNTAVKILAPGELIAEISGEKD